MGVTTDRISMDSHAILGQPVFTSGRKTMRNRRTSAAAAALAAAALAVVLTGCGDESKAEQKPSPTPTPSPSASASLSPEDQAKKDAEAGLMRFVDVRNQVGQRKAGLQALKKVAISEALGYQEQLSADSLKNGQKQVGETKVEIIRVDKVSMDNSDPAKGIAPYVHFRTCVDVSDVDVVDKAGKSVVTSDRKDRAIAEYTVTNYEYAKNPTNGWKVSVLEQKGTEEC